ncbi:MAG: CRTAC1 family protein [Planctomycetaceae bacterium]|nr:CRTAC1 family protein [Planctomycetaceae bacterium]
MRRSLPSNDKLSWNRGRWAVIGAAVLAGAGLAVWGGSRLVPRSGTERAARRAGVELQDVTDVAGITFVHTYGGSGKMYLMEAMTGGMAVLDYDNDGLIDLYFLNGAPLQGTPPVDPPPRNALYRNLGDWQFQDVTHEAGVGDTGFGLGVTVGDYDNDGFADIYVNNLGPNVLYHNNGDGTFSEVTRAVGIDPGDAAGAGAAFLDIDGDGDLDLYSGNYIVFSYDHHPQRIVGGFLRASSPLDFDADPDLLFRNNGDGTFTDVSEESGIAAHAGRTMGMVCGDFDNDGDTDIFICNDMMENFYWRNDGAGRFEEVAGAVGVAYDFWGRANGSMGASCGDYDQDGWLDIFMTDFQGEMPVLYHNLGGGFFEDRALQAGLTSPLQPHVNWGSDFLDIDNDGDRDLYVGNGHLEPVVDMVDSTTSYRVANVLFRNDGGGVFTDISAQSGRGLAVCECTRGVCGEDLDNDGDQDLVMVNQDARPTLLQNTTPAPRHWLVIRLVGLTSNRDGVGSHVTVRAGELAQLDEVHSCGNYQSQPGMLLHFGLGDHDRVDRIEVQWLGGGIDVLENVPADQFVTIVQGMTQRDGAPPAAGSLAP